MRTLSSFPRINLNSFPSGREQSKNMSIEGNIHFVFDILSVVSISLRLENLGRKL